MVFTEYFVHQSGDIMELKLFDAFLFKKGFMGPGAFVEAFGDLPSATVVVYRGINSLRTCEPGGIR
jgi:hypothetical protein